MFKDIYTDLIQCYLIMMRPYNHFERIRQSPMYYKLCLTKFNHEYFINIISKTNTNLLFSLSNNMANIKKILVVGEHLTGKSSIIQLFKEYEPMPRNESVSANDSTSNTMDVAMQFTKNNNFSSGNPVQQKNNQSQA